MTDIVTDGCPLSCKQLEELMDDDCHGPVSTGDPMLSSPHLSSHDVMSSPAPSSHYSTNDDALSPGKINRGLISQFSFLA